MCARSTYQGAVHGAAASIVVVITANHYWIDGVVGTRGLTGA
ncbi:unannotated protein [freshwater metagenome]|jgi:hypothetical protein|uniref:Unannotated protein n=1 Tax=freshwater metagenome TaxID=449393 RepID=A0A6J7AGT6_9ZZZZ